MKYNKYNYEEDTCFINDQIGGFEPTPKDPIRIIGITVRGVNVETTIGTLTTTMTTTTRVDTMIRIGPKIEMVIGYQEITIIIRGIGSTLHSKIMIVWEI